MVKIFEVDPKRPKIRVIAEAATTIRTGGLVIYPTETVYGLGADACSDEAVAKVFAAKARPLEDPIPVAVNSFELAQQIAELTPIAELALKKFLPGPLTMVVKAKPNKISKLVTGGTENIGIRIPDHPVVLKLIEFVGGPITATSANLSGKPAPSTIREALEQLGKRVDVALDSGKCRLGTPSTVVDLSSGSPRVLREGPISRKELSTILK
jgi:L-threonylcarbamoyladenylate synthase